MVYFPDPALFYHGIEGVLHRPHNNEMQEMIELFGCFAEDSKKAERNIPLQKLVASSVCFPKIDSKYQADLESGAYLVFSLGDHPGY